MLIVYRIGEFFPNNDVVIAPVYNNTRQIQHISTEELAAAIYNVANDCVGATVDSVFSETTKAYGFKRRTEKINSLMKEAYDSLKLSGKVREVDGKIVTI